MRSIIKDGNAIYMPKETINADKIAATFDIDKKWAKAWQTVYQKLFE
jgi:3-oxoacyl-[acyl-carrier-protein] synthase III